MGVNRPNTLGQKGNSMIPKEVEERRKVTKLLKNSVTIETLINKPEGV